MPTPMGQSLVRVGSVYTGALQQHSCRILKCRQALRIDTGKGNKSLPIKLHHLNFPGLGWPPYNYNPNERSQKHSYFISLFPSESRSAFLPNALAKNSAACPFSNVSLKKEEETTCETSFFIHTSLILSTFKTLRVLHLIQEEHDCALHSTS